jgi:hypothetical protein
MMLEGFGHEARNYAAWLHKNAQEMQILKYGFKVQKQEVNDYILSDPLEAVVERVKKESAERNDPLGAVLVGVDRPWEVCLLKLMVELVQHSVAGNIQDIRQQQEKRRNESDDFRRLVYRPAWPQRMRDEFRALLRGYPLLENLGTKKQEKILSDEEISALLECVFVGE